MRLIINYMKIRPLALAINHYTARVKKITKVETNEQFVHNFANWSAKPLDSM